MTPKERDRRRAGGRKAPRAGIQPLPTREGDEPRSLAEGLDRLVRGLGGPATSVLTDLFSRWSDLVGESVAAHSRPVAVRDGTLVVVVDDPAWASQLRWLEGRLVEQLGAATGGAVVALSIRVRAPGGGGTGSR